MRQKTFERIEQAWNKLPDDHEFEDWDQFWETANSLGEWRGFGDEFFLCPQRSNQPLGPSNLKLVNIGHELDYDRILHPAI